MPDRSRRSSSDSHKSATGRTRGDVGLAENTRRRAERAWESNRFMVSLLLCCAGVEICGSPSRSPRAVRCDCGGRNCCTLLAAEGFDEKNEAHRPEVPAMPASRDRPVPTRRYLLAWAILLVGLVGFWCCRPWLDPKTFNYGQFVVLLLTWKIASLLCLPPGDW